MQIVNLFETMESYLNSSGPIFLGIMIGLSTLLRWPRWTNYLWAGIAILWGVISFV